MPEWQKKELDRRKQEYKKGNLELYNWQSVHESLRNKYKWNCVTQVELKMILSWLMLGTKDSAKI